MFSNQIGSFLSMILSLLISNGRIWIFLLKSNKTKTTLRTLTVYEERLERCMCVPNNDITNYKY